MKNFRIIKTHTFIKVITLKMLLILCFVSNSLAIEVLDSNLKVQIPSQTGSVVDNASFLSASEQKQLTEQIRTIQLQGGPQIQILTVNSLQGLSMENFSITVAKQWGKGKQKRDDSVIIIITKKERATRIEVAQDIKVELTDYKTAEIINTLMLPEFKNNRFYAGLKNAIWAIASEFNISPTMGSELKNVVKHRAKVRGVGQFNFNIAIILSFIIFGVISTFVRNSFFKFLLTGVSASIIFHLLVQTTLFTLLAAIVGLFFGSKNLLNQKLSSMGYRKPPGHFGIDGFSGAWSSGSFSGGRSSGSW